MKFELLVYDLAGFKKALLQNLQDMFRGQSFSEMMRIRARKSELQAESRSYGPKSQSYRRADPQKSELNHPAKVPEWGFGASTENPR